MLEPVAYSQIFQLGGLVSPPLLSLSQFVTPIFFSFPFTLFLPSPVLFSPLTSSPLEVGLYKIQLEGLGERCELLQWGLGRSPSQNRIW